jgi:hypothetical protein
LAHDPYETTNLATEKPQERDRMLAEMRTDLAAKGAQYVRAVKNDAEEILPITP